MNRTRTAGILPLLLGAVLLTGCYKGDGTENVSFPKQTVPVQTSPNKEEIEASFTNVTADPDAPTDYPFSFDTAAVSEAPPQDIILVMLYDNAENKYQHTQQIVYFDKNGNCYRYRDALDIEGDWLPVLQAHLKSNPLPVSIASESERNTMRYLAAHAPDYEAADTFTQTATDNVVGVDLIYTIGADGRPVLLCRYDDISSCRNNSEVISFLNWFPYFFHPYAEFGQ